MTKATSSDAPAPTLDDYNPFDKNNTKTGGNSSNEPAVMKTEPPAYSQTAAQQQATTADFQVKTNVKN